MIDLDDARARPPIVLLDLTGDQVAQAEAAVGYPMDQWAKADKGKLYPLLWALVDGGKPADYGGLPFGVLAGRIRGQDTEGKGPSGSRSPGSPEP